MKKNGKRIIIFVLAAVIISVSFVSCGSEGKNLKEKSETTNVPIKSFGNQAAQMREWLGLTVDKGWVYTVISMDSGDEGIVKFPIDDPQKKVVIYEYVTDSLSQLSVLDDWVYFRAGTGDHGYEKTNLYKIKTDGTEKTKLANDMWSYILTEDHIYYDSNGIGSTKIYVIDHDGKNKHKLGGSELVGIDNGWIYYGEVLSDELYIDMPCHLYKMRPDGTNKQKVLNDIITECIIDNDEVYYIGYDKKNEETTDLVQRSVDGKERVLDSNIYFRSLNKENDWLYYDDEDEGKIYKINITDPEKRELVYDYGEDIVQGILLDDGDVYITLSENLVYIDKDGDIEKIKLWDF